jgi:hypothetical protein
MSESQTVIDKLTPEQEAMIPVFREKFRAIGLSTEPTNRAEAERAVIDSYLYFKKPVPEVVWANSPAHGAKMAAQALHGREQVTTQEIQEQAGSASYGSFEAYWVSLYSYIANVLPVQKDELADIAERIVTHCGVYWTFEDLVILTEKPKEIHMKDGKLHREDGLALVYGDGTGVFAINGERKASLMDVVLSEQYSEKETEAEESTED